MSRCRMNLILGLLLLTGCAVPFRSENPKALHFAPLSFDLPQVEQFRLSNGVRVFLREDHELPLVTLSAMLEGGGVDDPAGKSGLARLHASAMRSGGAGDMSADAVDAALDRLAADLSVGSDAYATTLNLSVQRSDLEEGLGILCNMLRRPRFEEKRVELARRRLVESIRRQADHPGVVAYKALVSAVYDGHPLGELPSVESVAAVTRQELTAFHRRFFKPDNLWLAVSGDIDRKTLETVLGRSLSGWQGSIGAVRNLKPLPAPEAPTLRLVSKDIPQTTIQMGSRGIDKNDHDLYALRVLNFILGGGDFNSRLMQEIRTRRGLAYSVYSAFQIGRRLPGLFVAGAETKNASADEVVLLMRQEMEKLTREPVTGDELALAKDSLINSFVFAFEDAHEVVSQTMRLAFYGYPDDYLSLYRKRLAAVTADDVLAAARRHLHPEDLTTVLVGAPDHPEALAEKLDLPLRMEKADGQPAAQSP